MLSAEMVEIAWAQEETLDRSVGEASLLEATRMVKYIGEALSRADRGLTDANYMSSPSMESTDILLHEFMSRGCVDGV